MNRLILTAIETLCRRQGQKISIPQGMGDVEGELGLQDLCRRLHIPLRRIALRSDWWRKTGLSLLTFKAGSGEPILLLSSRRGYRVLDVGSGQSWTHTAYPDVLPTHAWQLYLSGWGCGGGQLYGFILQDVLRGSTSALAVNGLILSVLSLVLPFSMAVIFDDVVPTAHRYQLGMVLLFLLSGGVLSLVLMLSRTYRVLGIESQFLAHSQAQTWYRLLQQPMTFFRHRSVGDLVDRANGLLTLKSVVSMQILQMIFGLSVGVVSLGYLFIIQAKLAVLALLMGVFGIGVTAVLSYRLAITQARVAKISGALSGWVLQLVKGIPKLRLAMAQQRAFAKWLLPYVFKRQWQFKEGISEAVLLAFNAGYILLSTAVLFVFVYDHLKGVNAFTTGLFLAFHTAYIQYLMSLMAVGNCMSGFLRIRSVLNRLQPIVDTELPVRANATVRMPQLEGRLAFAAVSFAYPDQRPILKQLSFHVDAGEYVAIVGPSGAGKSTLLRVLLGLEQASGGTVFIDDKDIKDVDLPSLRQQVGVVLQHGALLMGDILLNITLGRQDISMDAVLKAVDMAGLGSLISSLPMGLYTYVNDDTPVLSAGQRQRIMMARALVGQPKLLVFDEATSAVDNHIQAEISRRLDQLSATRLVVAHRLSTIRHADRILVMDQGRIVEEGPYDLLLRKNGLFARLVANQL